MNDAEIFGGVAEMVAGLELARSTVKESLGDSSPPLVEVRGGSARWAKRAIHRVRFWLGQFASGGMDLRQVPPAILSDFLARGWIALEGKIVKILPEGRAAGEEFERTRVEPEAIESRLAEGRQKDFDLRLRFIESAYAGVVRDRDRCLANLRDAQARCGELLEQAREARLEVKNLREAMSILVFAKGT